MVMSKAKIRKTLKCNRTSLFLDFIGDYSDFEINSYEGRFSPKSYTNYLNLIQIEHISYQ